MRIFHAPRRPVRAVLSVLLALAAAGTRPAVAAGMRLIDFGQLGYQSQITTNGTSDVATELVEDPRGKALEIRCTAGANANPGIVVRPGAGLKWNLAAYGEVEADVANLSDVPLVINLRVDNPGGADGHETRGNSDRLTLPVGKSGTVRVYFGYSLGKKAYALEPARINQLVLFTAKPAKGETTFRVTAIRANGKPGDKPAGAPDDAAAAPPPPASPSPVPSASPSAAPTASPSASPAASPSASPAASPAASATVVPSASATPDAGKSAASPSASPKFGKTAPAAVKRPADKERPADNGASPSPSERPAAKPDKSASPVPTPSAAAEKSAAATVTATVSPAASATPATKEDATPSPSPSPTPKKG